MSESRATALAAKLRTALLSPGLVTASGRLSRRGILVASLVLAVLLVWLHAKVQDPSVHRHTDILAQLAAVKLLDARWDVAVNQARSDAAGATQPVVHSGDMARIQRALDAADDEAKSTVLRVSVSELKKAYAEKADLVTRYQRAGADSRQALEAAMRADAAIAALVRNAWRDFPQRERLVAAENLVARVLAEAQQYQHAPSAAHRAALEAYAADLPRAHSLPRSVAAGLARLESDIHQLLLLKPLELMLGDRLAVLNTGPRVDELAETFQRELADALARRDRYRIALSIYSGALILLLGYLGVRAWIRYRELEERYAQQTGELADALDRLSERETDEPTSALRPAAEERSADAESSNVRVIRRP